MRVGSVVGFALWGARAVGRATPGCGYAIVNCCVILGGPGAFLRVRVGVSEGSGEFSGSLSRVLWVRCEAGSCGFGAARGYPPWGL